MLDAIPTTADDTTVAGHGGKRPGAGRPVKIEDAVVVGVRLPAAIAARYAVEAGRRGITASEVLREVAVEHAPRLRREPPQTGANES